MKIFAPGKIIIGLIMLLLISTYLYFHFGFYFGQTVQDPDNNFGKLSAAFRSHVSAQCPGPYNSCFYEHSDGSWEIIQPGPGVPWYANFVDTNGNRADNFLTFQTIWTDIDKMYFTKPYLFLSSHPGFLHIYNVETRQLRTIEARSLSCRGSGQYLTGVAYDGGILYTEQFMEMFPLCNGGYQRRLNLDF